MKNKALHFIRHIIGTQQILDYFSGYSVANPTEHNLRGDSNASFVRDGIVGLLKQATEESWFHLKLNGVNLLLPKYTIMTMHHCLHFQKDDAPYLLVETQHWEKMRSWLAADGGVFLDVGAATGAMCVPFDLSIENNVRFIAFEPSRRTREYLEKTIQKNNCKRIEVLPYAASDTVGVCEFVDLPLDPTDACPYLPEESHLAFNEQKNIEGSESYAVEVKTLDSLIKSMNLPESGTIVVKIDVEGFEAEVLRGAKSLLDRFHPYLSIDIHRKPGADFETHDEVCALLSPYGYSLERIAHVLLAIPPEAR